MQHNLADDVYRLPFPFVPSVRYLCSLVLCSRPSSPISFTGCLIAFCFIFCGCLLCPWESFPFMFYLLISLISPFHFFPFFSSDDNDVHLWFRSISFRFNCACASCFRSSLFSTFVLLLLPSLSLGWSRSWGLLLFCLLPSAFWFPSLSSSLPFHFARGGKLTWFCGSGSEDLSSLNFQKKCLE